MNTVIKVTYPYSFGSCFYESTDMDEGETSLLSIQLNTENISEYLNLDKDNPADTCPVARYLRTRIKEEYVIKVQYGNIRIQSDNPNLSVFSIEMPNMLRDWIFDFDLKVFSTKMSGQTLLESVLSLNVEVRVPTEVLLVK